LAIGVENIFRLLNAVIKTPAESNTVIRIGNALGSIGHLTLAAAAQNVVILWLLSKVVSAGVSAFCTFAIVALLFDFFFHLTFFLAVLSVDVRRMELQDSLDRVDLLMNQRTTRKRSFDTGQDSDAWKQRWLDEMLQGRAPFSTRIAGSAIMICFVWTLNWHFFDDETPLQFFQRLYQAVMQLGSSTAGNRIPDIPGPVNQVRTHKAWLGLQDNDMAKEIVNAVHPHAHSIVARVYEPLVFVMNGANRSDNVELSPLLARYFDLESISQHFQPFLVVVVSVAATVTILMSYLLWDEIPDSVTQTGTEEDDPPPLNVASLGKGHILDIIMLSASAKGVIASVGLDRQIRVWGLKSDEYASGLLKLSELEDQAFWPIVGLSIDDDAQWLAICSQTGLVLFYDLHKNLFMQSIKVSAFPNKPAACFFTPRQDGHSHNRAQNHSRTNRIDESTNFIIVRKSGTLDEITLETGETLSHEISKSPIISAHPVPNQRLAMKIVTLSRSGCVKLSFRLGGEVWTSERLTVTDNITVESPSIEEVPYWTRDVAPPRDPTNALAIFPLPALDMVLVVQATNVSLLSLHSGAVIRTFQIGQAIASSVRVISSPQRPCLSCGAPGVASFSIVYTERETDTMYMHTFCPNRLLICLRAERDPREKRCVGFEGTKEGIHWVTGVEAWEAVGSNAVLGVRKVIKPSSRQSSSKGSEVYEDGASPSSGIESRSSVDSAGLRQRFKKGLSYNVIAPTSYFSFKTKAKDVYDGEDSDAEPDDERQGFCLSSTGVLITTPLTEPKPDYFTNDEDMEDENADLFITRLGPIVKVARRAVAVAYGRSIRVLLFGTDRLESVSNDEDDNGFGYMGNGGKVPVGVHSRRRRNGRSI
jgi:Sterol-sensing domain of SREBP cleavage-activation